MFLDNFTFPSSNLVTVVPVTNSKSYLASENVNCDDEAAEINKPILPDDNGVVPSDPDKFNPVPSESKELERLAINVPP